MSVLFDLFVLSEAEQLYLLRLQYGFIIHCNEVSVCAYVCLLAYLQNARNFLYVLTVSVAWSSSDDNAIRYVLPVLWMTSYLPIIGQAKATSTGRVLKMTH